MSKSSNSDIKKFKHLVSTDPTFGSGIMELLALTQNQSVPEFSIDILMQLREQVVDLEEETKSRTVFPWIDDPNNLMTWDESMTRSINKAISSIREALDIVHKRLNRKIDILEVGSGNGINSDKIKSYKKIRKFTASDAWQYEHVYLRNTEYIIAPSHEAVQRYKGNIDLLLMIFPSCSTYMDYYAIKAYEEKSQTGTKYLVFVGELGGAEGTIGMYQYLLNEKKHLSAWKLLYRREFITISSAIREVFLFTYSN